MDEINLFRPSNPPQLIAVSKTYPKRIIQEAIESGISVFGENKITEALEKFSDLKIQNPSLEIHHIGPVQSGTLKKLFGVFSFTHGVGSLSSLKELCRVAQNKKTLIKYFLQVNLSLEDSKSGFTKSEIISLLQNLSEYNTEFSKFHGLMTMGPESADPIVTRKIFQELALIRTEYSPDAKLSMGMSGDYKIALEEGSDYLRIGSAIFGNRS